MQACLCKSWTCSVPPGLLTHRCDPLADWSPIQLQTIVSNSQAMKHVYHAKIWACIVLHSNLFEELHVHAGQWLQRAVEADIAHLQLAVSLLEAI